MQQEDRYKLQYFTGTQASIWIGETWVAECFGISFSASQNIIPIFGYASNTFDAVAKGRVLVQGQFEINFIDEGYLYYTLHKMNAEKIRDPSEFNESQYLLTGEIPHSQSDVVNRVNELSNLERVPSDDENKQQVAAAVKAASELNLEAIDRVIQELDIQRKVGQQAGLRNNSRSIIYDMIPFNLQGIFGNPEWTKNVTEKRLLNCFLVSNEMVVSVDDQPLRERYTFIGQVHK